MKRLLVFLCVTLCVLGSVTAVSAIPIPEGGWFTWFFDTSSLTQGSTADQVFWFISFETDLFDKEEMIQYVWGDEILSTPLATHVDYNYLEDELGLCYYGFPLDPPLTVDDDLYLRVIMVAGSTNVSSVGLYGLGEDTTLAILGSPVAAVPEPATMLLIGTGLVGLGIFRRKLRKS